MSRETKLALDEALRVHIASETDGDILTEYSLVTASISMDDIGTGRVTYYLEGPDHQPAHVSTGLLRLAESLVLQAIDENLRDD